MVYYEFDSSSGWMRAECLTHASWTQMKVWVAYGWVEYKNRANNSGY